MDSSPVFLISVKLSWWWDDVSTRIRPWLFLSQQKKTKICREAMLYAASVCSAVHWKGGFEGMGRVKPIFREIDWRNPERNTRRNFWIYMHLPNTWIRKRQIRYTLNHFGHSCMQKLLLLLYYQVLIFIWSPYSKDIHCNLVGYPSQTFMGGLNKIVC